MKEELTKIDEEFKDEPKCKHGETRGHYICEPHDYPHVIGNRFGPDCETCNPPKKKTFNEIKSFIINRDKELLDYVVVLCEDVNRKIEQYVETLITSEPIYYDGSFDVYHKVVKIPSFTGFIEWLTGKEISENKEN